MDIGKNIKNLRRSKDMTQEEAYSIIMGKKITLPSRQILAKRNLQWLYHDSDNARRSTASKHYREEFGDELWDGSEAVFAKML